MLGQFTDFRKIWYERYATRGQPIQWVSEENNRTHSPFGPRNKLNIVDRHDTFEFFFLKEKTC